MIKESELVLSSKGGLYHIDLVGNQIADTVVLVGDPKRVDAFRPFFTSIEQETENRELHSITGVYRNTSITVLSTGMGTDNIDIVLNELDAAVNMDLDKRMPKTEHRKLNLIRVGTSGALHADIPVGSIVASSYAIGLDGLLNYYKYDDSMFEPEMAEAFYAHAKFDDCFAKPYVVRGSEMLLDKLGSDAYKGITATAPGFYAPQGRQVRLETRIEDINSLLSSFEYSGNRVLNFEMETSAIYGLSRLLGHNALTMCLIIANRATGTFLNNYKPNMNELIEKTLYNISCM